MVTHRSSCVNSGDDGLSDIRHSIDPALIPTTVAPSDVERVPESSADLSIKVTPQSPDPKSMPLSSNECNRQSASSTTTGDPGGPTSNRICSRICLINQFWRSFRDATSDELMLFSLVMDYSIEEVERTAAHFRLDPTRRHRNS